MRDRLPWVLVVVLGVLVVVLMVRILVGDDEDGAADTTTPPAPTAPSTTTIPETTTPPATATTGVTSTTASTAPDTTTTTLAGAWADEPLVVSGFGALGWWDGVGWIQVETGTALPVAGGETYQVARLGTSADVVGGAPTTVCEPLENPGVPLDDGAVLGEFPGPFGVAVSAPWLLIPHPVDAETDDGTYAGFAADLLSDRGLEVTDPVIAQLLRVDLEGDGTDEVLVVAEAITGPGLFPEPGDYSIAFLRRVVDGEVRTAILGESIPGEPAEGETPFILSFRIGAVADLNGDGRMEVVLSSVYYEGAGVEVWEYVDDDLGPVRVLGQGCGS